MEQPAHPPSKPQTSVTRPRRYRITAGSPPRIDDYAFIGNCRSGALISRDGSIDWLCFPRFDSPSLFAAILDRYQGGCFKIAPAGECTVSRRYLPDTNILETRFDTPTGSARLTDCMLLGEEVFPRQELHPDIELLRRITCDRGSVELELRYDPRPDYARKKLPLRPVHPDGLMLDLGDAALCLYSSVPLAQTAPNSAHVRFSLRTGQSADFSLVYSETAPLVIPPLGERTNREIDATAAWWRNWASRLRYDGPWRDTVTRSALTLKLLTYSPSGAVLAAPTTSLPERIGGSLNFDYRYCWLRDAAFTVRALHRLGCDEEAHGFVNWLLHATALNRPELRVLYDVYGITPGRETTLDHLNGFGDSQPVRVGNAAAFQHQLDVYGEVIDALAQLIRDNPRPLDRDTQSLLKDYGEYVCRNWQRPDAGIWEKRRHPEQFTESKALAWVALDRIISLHDQGVIHHIPIDFFRRNRAMLREQITERGWSRRRKSYLRTIDGEDYDAATLLLMWYGFEDPASERSKATISAIEKHLGAGHGLLFRNRDYAENAFAVCSFWLADLLAQGAGTLEQATARFEQLLTYANDLGLYGEEIDPATGETLGNFPQAYTHVGLINAALSIQDREQMEHAGRKELHERK